MHTLPQLQPLWTADCCSFSRGEPALNLRASEEPASAVSSLLLLSMDLPTSCFYSKPTSVSSKMLLPPRRKRITKSQPSAGHDTHPPESMTTAPQSLSQPPGLVPLQAWGRDPGLHKKSSLCRGSFPVLALRQKPSTHTRT